MAMVSGNSMAPPLAKNIPPTLMLSIPAVNESPVVSSRGLVGQGLANSRADPGGGLADWGPTGCGKASTELKQPTGKTLGLPACNQEVNKDTRLLQNKFKNEEQTMKSAERDTQM